MLFTQAFCQIDGGLYGCLLPLSSSLNFDLACHCYVDDDDDTWSCCDCTCGCPGEDARIGFMNFVDRVLMIRGSSNIVKLNLSCRTEILDSDRVCTWIIAALRRPAHHFRLQVDVSEPIELPHNLFTSNISKLELLFCSSFRNPVRLPISITTASRIKNLKLKSVVFPDGNANGDLILSCPVLKNMKIIDAYVSRLRLLPLLERLKLCGVHASKDSSCKVKICTPNLKWLNVSFYLDGLNQNSVVGYSLENLSSLDHAEVCLYSYDVSDEMSSRWLFEILSGIYNVEFLKLSRRTLQALTNFPELLEKLPDRFQQLKHVMLELEPPSVHAVLNFVESFPCIETLVWNRCPDESCFSPKREEWVANLPFQSIFKCLKTFVMQNFSNVEVEMKFVEFLLERAIVLEELIIKSWMPSFLDVKKKLLSVRRASSTASISFPERVSATSYDIRASSVNLLL